MRVPSDRPVVIESSRKVEQHPIDTPRLDSRSPDRTDLPNEWHRRIRLRRKGRQKRLQHKDAHQFELILLEGAGLFRSNDATDDSDAGRGAEGQ